MSDILTLIDWAVDAIRSQETFGQDELTSARSRERRAKSVLLDCKKEIEQLRGTRPFELLATVTQEVLDLREENARLLEENKKMKEAIENQLERSHSSTFHELWKIDRNYIAPISEEYNGYRIIVNGFTNDSIKEFHASIEGLNEPYLFTSANDALAHARKIIDEEILPLEKKENN